MTSLLRLWQVSLALCALGLLVLLGLVVARLLSTRMGNARKEARREILPMLLADGGYRGQMRGLELEVAADLVAELAEMTAGSERSAMLERASAMGVPSLLESRIKARSAQVRLSSVETLALFDRHGTLAAQALDDPNPDVRLAAALVLAQRTDAPHPAILVDKLGVGSQEHSMLVVSLMTDLAENDPGAVAGLLFERDIPYEAKVAAIDALAKVGAQYAPLLAQMADASSSEAELQPRLFRALGRTGHPAGRDTILRGLASANWPVRASATEAAGKTRLAEAADALGKLLSDDNWWVRFRAGEALLRMGPRGVAVLHEASASEDETVRTSAQAILAERRAA